MKKYLFLLITSVLLFGLQSCSVNTDVTYHKDSASSLLMDVDFKDLLAMAKSQGGDDAKGMEELDKLPKDWISLYDMQLKEGGKVSKNPDSVRLMKKMFIKGNYVVNELSGLSLKLDRFSKADYEGIAKLSESGKEKLPMNNNYLNNWDGKKLIINTDMLNLKDLEKIMSEQGEDGEEMDPEQAKAMMQMMLKKYEMNLKFESDIKSITGKHDWVKQIDKRTVKVTLDTSNLDGSKKLTDADKEIIIVTE